MVNGFVAHSDQNMFWKWPESEPNLEFCLNCTRTCMFWLFWLLCWGYRIRESFFSLLRFCYKFCCIITQNCICKSTVNDNICINNKNYLLFSYANTKRHPSLCYHSFFVLQWSIGSGSSWQQKVCQLGQCGNYSRTWIMQCTGLALW